MIQNFSCRARIDDLIADIFVFMRERYFLNDEVKYRDRKQGSRRLRTARIIGVSYVDGSESNSALVEELSGKKIRRCSSSASKKHKKTVDSSAHDTKRNM